MKTPQLLLPAVSLSFSAVVAVAAATPNGVYNFQTAFGASGSQKTMACMANGTQTLNRCSGGDFSVGSTIYIQSAGVLPTISTPSTPAVACVAQNGASCAGAITYCYEIAAIQSAPNGAMTAASAPSCSRQSPQTWPAIVGDKSTPVIYTTVVLPQGTHIGLYAVYRNVNGGPFSFYTLLPPGTLSDYNDHATNWTCADVGLASCSPPSSPLPNDVYAKITGVNGSTYTIGPLSPQPKYSAADNDSLPGSPFMPSMPTVSRAVTVQHDDTPALYTMANVMRSNSGTGPLSVHIPAGSYNFHSANDPYGSGSAVHLNMIKNLTIAGDGDGTRLYVSNDRGYRHSRFIRAVCGFAGSEPAGNCVGSYFLGLGYAGTPYTLTDPVPAGATRVTLANPADSAKFSVGGYVTIALNFKSSAQHPFPETMWGELNKVEKIDSATGTLTLAYPTDKMYASRSLLTNPYSACSRCPTNPPIISPVGPNGKAVLENLTLKDFSFRGLTIFLETSVADFITEENLTIVANEKHAEQIGRHHYVNNERLTEDSGIWGQGSYFASATAGSGDILVTNSQYKNSHFGNSSQPCSESSANVVWRNNSFDISGFENGGSIVPGIPFIGGSLSFGCEFANNVVNLNKTHFAFFIDLIDAVGSAYIHGNTFNIDSMGANRSAASTMSSRAVVNSNIVFDRNTWNLGSGDGPREHGSNIDFSHLTSYRLPPQTGNIAIHPHLSAASLLVIPMSGNITAVDLGSNRVLGSWYWVAFEQPGVGGPYVLPTACASWGAVLDCAAKGAPAADPAPNSTTFFEFYDDGTTVHYVARVDGGQRSQKVQ